LISDTYIIHVIMKICPTGPNGLLAIPLILNILSGPSRRYRGKPDHSVCKFHCQYIKKKLNRLSGNTKNQKLPIQYKKIPLYPSPRYIGAAEGCPLRADHLTKLFAVPLKQVEFYEKLKKVGLWGSKNSCHINRC